MLFLYTYTHTLGLHCSRQSGWYIGDFFIDAYSFRFSFFFFRYFCAQHFVRK